MSGWSPNRAAVLACMAWLFTPAAAAQTEVKSAVWRQVIEQYVERQNLSAGLRTSVEVAADEPGPPACQRSPRMADSSRTRWLGPLTVVLQCDQPAWRWSVNVRVRGMAQVVQAGRSLPGGQLLRTEDLRLVDADIATEPLGVLTDLAQALGRETARPIKEGASLVLNALRQATVIKVGDRVTVRLIGQAFQVSAEGVAQQAGGVGDTIRVKMPDGKLVVANVVRPGHVDVKL
ncbi:MAG: flagella basal body P-ring formation protein FlgA [Betaproteobacteria bacterium]|nr:flagella basal body P-ring formation protein FlgA [Betaproteobacteria bacterium]